MRRNSLIRNQRNLVSASLDHRLSLLCLLHLYPPTALRMPPADQAQESFSSYELNITSY